MYKNLLKIIPGFHKKNIMIIGDMVADVYLEGKIARISREAPVLILEHAAETVVPGGAANVVHNVAMLTGSVYAVGVVGDDYAGRELGKVLQDKQALTAGLITDAARPTITKTRVMAGGQATVRQQIVRIDREKKEDLSLAVEQQVLEYIKENISSMQGVVISDYGSKTITPLISSSVLAACQQQAIPCIVDSRYNIMNYRGATVIKQNEAEAAAAVGYELTDRKALLTAGRTLQEQLAAQAVLITLGPEGMALFEHGGGYTHIPVSNKSEVYDVTGAGDTVVAAMSLALAAGACYADAARLANFAAGIVVKKAGTATATPQELGQLLATYSVE